MIGQAKNVLVEPESGACIGRLADVGESQTGWGISFDSMANSNMDMQVRTVDRPLHPLMEGRSGGGEEGSIEAKPGIN